MVSDIYRIDMRPDFLFLLLGILLSTSCSSQLADTKDRDKVYGLSFVASNRELASEDIIPVKEVNANWVALMPFGFMNTPQDPAVRFNTSRQWWGEREEGIRTTSGLFKDQNIKRMLKPQIWIRGGVFTGFISMTSEEDWQHFEDQYSAFILFYATIAEEEAFDMFCIGTELNYFVVQRPEYWEQLISEIKQVYSGKLTYAANWDSFKNPQFWRRLDYIGVDAYFPLSDSSTPSVASLKTAWTPIKADLKNFSEATKKSVIFTEYGYRSIDFTAREPWDSNVAESFNETAQSNALNALYETFWEASWFAGGFLWKWFDHSDAGGKGHTGFTVQNKSTEKTVQEFYPPVHD